MGRTVANAAFVLAGAVALVGPAHAEWSALQQVREGVARCPGADEIGTTTCGGLARADVDIDGLRLSHPWAERRGLHVEAEEVAIGLGSDGVTVEPRAVRLLRMPTTDGGPSRAEADTDVDSGVDASEVATEAQSRRAPLSTYGVPVQVRVQGPATWTHAGITVQLDSLELRLDGHGAATARFDVRAQGRGLRLSSLDRWEARVIDSDPRFIHAEGALALADGPPTFAAVTLSPHAIDAELRDGSGGRLELSTPLPAAGSPRPGSAWVRASDFRLAALGRIGARSLAAWGIDTADAVLDAELSLQLSDAATDSSPSVHLEYVDLAGLVVDQPKLAREPVRLDALQVHGDLGWDPGGETVSAELWVGHRGAALTLSAHRRADALQLDAALAPLPCQALVDALPDAMTEMLSGTELSGDIEGTIALRVDRRALAQARALPQRPSDAPPPGSLELSFPFLERCAVVRDDPRLDLAALTGPYRHRFVDADGNHQARLLAPGAPSYAALHEVPLLSRAFVTLEDRRYWSHDGFDREQIVNAFWHNLVKGRVSRGASTISQQAARNLWLGVDRSVGRKLQEALLTARLEATTDKTRIMELYLNVIELGPGIHGVQDAARRYFGKPASELSALQAVHIAALAPAPSRYSASFVNGQVSPEWRQMLDDHVRRMFRAGFITRAQLMQALRSDLQLLDRRPSEG